MICGLNYQTEPTERFLTLCSKIFQPVQSAIGKNSENDFCNGLIEYKVHNIFLSFIAFFMVQKLALCD